MKIENNTTNVTKASKTITTTTTKPDTNNKAKGKQIMSSNSGWLLDQKIEDATSGLRREFSKDLHSISEENALTIANYILAMRVEINLSDSYRLNVISDKFKEPAISRSVRPLLLNSSTISPVPGNHLLLIDFSSLLQPKPKHIEFNYLLCI